MFAPSSSCSVVSSGDGVSCTCVYCGAVWLDNDSAVAYGPCVSDEVRVGDSVEHGNPFDCGFDLEVAAGDVVAAIDLGCECDRCGGAV